jgi:hypothetical protein
MLHQVSLSANGDWNVEIIIVVVDLFCDNCTVLSDFDMLLYLCRLALAIGMSVLWYNRAFPRTLGTRYTRKRSWWFVIFWFIKFCFEKKNQISMFFLLLCTKYVFVCFDCLFVYSCLSNFSAIWQLPPLPVTGLQILTMLSLTLMVFSS